MSDTESFEYAIKVMRENLTGMYDNGHMTSWANVDTSVDLELIQKAHDREIRDTTQQEYHRGYEDAMHARATATWQLDRERMEAVRRLREIESSSGQFVKSLAQALGIEWTGQRVVATIAEVRDCLIHLLGGDSNSANSGECSANNLQNSPNPINKDAETEPYLMESAEFHKLGEREKVVRKLQALRFDGGSHENLSKLAYAIYPCATGWTCESAKGLRDKLVDLMGGVSDESVHVGGLRCVDGCMGDVSNGGDTGRTHDSPSNRDRNHMGVREGVGGDDGGHCESTCQHCDACSNVRAGGVGESTETITDELREWADSDVWSCKWEEFKAIADRIDEQFARICEQQEAVLQETIGYLGDRVIEAKADRDRYKDACKASHDQINRLKNAHLDKTLEVAALTEECEMYQDLLRDARDEYVELQLKHWREVDDHIDEREHDLSKIMWVEKERDELQAKLDMIRRALQ